MKLDYKEAFKTWWKSHGERFYGSQGISELQAECIFAAGFNELADSLETLQDWKEQQLIVENMWDVQEVGRLIGAKLGTHIRPQIAPYIIKLQRELGK